MDTLKIQEKENPIKKSRHKNRIVLSLQNITVVLTLLEICDSLISLYTAIVPTIVSYALLAMWFVISILYIDSKKKFGNLVKNLIPVILYLLFCFIKVLIGGNFVEDFWSPVKLVINAIALLMCVVMVHTILCLPKECRIFILKVFLVLGAITVIPSLIYLRSYPDAVRDVYEGFANVNFAFVYATVPMTILAFYMLKTKNVGNKLYFILFFVFNALLLSLANFATALVSMLIGLIFMLFCTKKMKFKSFLFGILCGILLLIIFRNLIGNLCYEFANLDIFSAIMRKRITAIGDFLLGKGGGSSFDNRILLMSRSWRSFLHFPIFGVPATQYGNGTVGLHETWVSLLGTTGVVGTGLFIWTLVVLLKNIFKNMKYNNFKVAYKVILLLCVFVSFLNPLAYRDALIAIFVICPMFEDFFEISKKVRYK